MKTIFLDIDGVLNNCMAIGVFHESSTITRCIVILNEIIQKTNSKVVIISTWKDNYNFEVIKNLLYERGVLQNNIVGCTEKDISKEIGITNYLQLNVIDKYVIIDDNLSFKNYQYNNFYVKTDSHTGLQQENVIQILKALENINFNN